MSDELFLKLFKKIIKLLNFGLFAHLQQGRSPAAHFFAYNQPISQVLFRDSCIRIYHWTLKTLMYFTGSNHLQLP